MTNQAPTGPASATNPTAATTIEGTEPAPQTRPSLHDVLCEKLIKDHPLYSRVVLVGKRTPPDSLKAMFRDAATPTKVGIEDNGPGAALGFEHVKINSANLFTGIYAETPGNFLFFLEGEPKHLLKSLRFLQGAKQRKEKTENVCVLAYTDDIPDRSYTKFVTIDITNQGTTLVQNEDTIRDEIVTLIYRLMDVGNMIMSKEKQQLESFLNQMKTNRPELLPSVGQLDSFLEAAGFLFTLDEFLEVFNTPVDIKLQGEMVWPVPPPLKY